MKDLLIGDLRLSRSQFQGVRVVAPLDGFVELDFETSIIFFFLLLSRVSSIILNHVRFKGRNYNVKWITILVFTIDKAVYN